MDPCGQTQLAPRPYTGNPLGHCLCLYRLCQSARILTGFPFGGLVIRSSHTHRAPSQRLLPAPSQATRLLSRPNATVPAGTSPHLRSDLPTFNCCSRGTLSHFGHQGLSQVRPTEGSVHCCGTFTESLPWIFATITKICTGDSSSVPHGTPSQLSQALRLSVSPRPSTNPGQSLLALWVARYKRDTLVPSIFGTAQFGR